MLVSANRYGKRKVSIQAQHHEDESLQHKIRLLSLFDVKEEQNRKLSQVLEAEIAEPLSLVNNQLMMVLDHLEQGQVFDDVEQGRELIELLSIKVGIVADQLLPTELWKGGLLPSLERMAVIVCKGKGIDKVFVWNHPAMEPNPVQSMLLYRLTEEVVKNIANHSKATFLQMTQRMENNLYTLALYHNGEGLEQEQFETLAITGRTRGVKLMKTYLEFGQATICFARDEEGTATVTIQTELWESSREKVPVKE
jgi:glucose-6-phosphate-specific signal transduction histidine kinase